MSKVVLAKEAISHIKDGMSIMVGGFMVQGTPETLIDAIVECGAKDLTIICNDAGYPDKGVGKLISNGQVKKLIASHIGLNPMAGELMNEGKMEVVLVPQGTLVEQIRSGGAGLGGVLTPTGLGTIVEEGKKILEIQGEKYLLEEALKADVALIGGSIVDKKGNIVYRYTTQNFNKVMATAAELVMVGAKEIVEPGTIHVDNVMTPHLFVDYIVKEGE
ncbi:CoA transferase subunit A [uncultured Ilyobacter sp.]|uniref:CoA transferase subunit A n=1 Tax=uncultured Ilyobacter sp. TaxID=544433 RepID=UPI0029C05168|nr:CoA transferase subunit A [uncultured Ilyobacter sp.]